MSRKTLRCFVFLLAMPIGTARAQGPSASAVATAMWQELDTTHWSVAYAPWQDLHRQARCDQFVAPTDEIVDYGIGGVEFWSYRCRQSLRSSDAEWLFYAWTPGAPIVARLEQFRASIVGLPRDQLTVVHRDLSTRLSTRYGAGQDLRDGGAQEFGGAFWRSIVRWQNPQLEIYLYVLDDCDSGAPCVKVQVRHRALIAALATARRLDAQNILQGAESGTALDTQLATQLGAEFPTSSVLLSSPGRPQDDQRALPSAVVELLDAATTGTPERRALLLLAADRLAGRLFETERESQAWDEQRKRLGMYGLTFQWDELGASWVYTHDLLWRIWQELRDTLWGHQAFLLLQSRGWDTSVGCQGGRDQFRQVIAHGEPLLRDRLRTPDRAQILLSLAQSYETWWSLSRASDREEYANPREYRVGADVARQRAIEYYDELRRLYRTTDEAAYARLALPRLRLGIDTGQRRFFCVYD